METHNDLCLLYRDPGYLARSFGICYGLAVCTILVSCVEALTPNGMVLRGGALGM